MMMTLTIKLSLLISLVYFQRLLPFRFARHGLRKPHKPSAGSFHGTVWLPDVVNRLGEKFTVSTMPLFAIFTRRAQVFTQTSRFGLLLASSGLWPCWRVSEGRKTSFTGTGHKTKSPTALLIPAEAVHIDTNEGRGAGHHGLWLFCFLWAVCSIYRGFSDLYSLRPEKPPCCHIYHNYVSSKMLHQKKPIRSNYDGSDITLIL